METVIIILAAGNASRFGAPKLVAQAAQTLLQHTITEAVTTGFGVMVVTGAYENELRESIERNKVLHIHNPHWQKGMASSIQTGLRASLEQFPALQQVIITTADQPLINTSLFLQLLDAQQKNETSIVACGYANTVGIPVLFQQTWFERLFQLSGPQGAKQLLLENLAQVSVVPFEGGAIDIDTPEDYKQWWSA